MQSTIQDNLNSAWIALTTNQKRVIVGIGLLLLVFLLSGWFSAFRGWREIRIEKRNAELAEAQAQTALKNAAKIAVKIIEREKDLQKAEVKRNEKEKEFDDQDKQVGSDRADYDHARAEPVERVPGTDELCAEFAKLGYPCEGIQN